MAGARAGPLQVLAARGCALIRPGCRGQWQGGQWQGGQWQINQKLRIHVLESLYSPIGHFRNVFEFIHVCLVTNYYSHLSKALEFFFYM